MRYGASTNSVKNYFADFESFEEDLLSAGFFVVDFLSDAFEAALPDLSEVFIFFGLCFELIQTYTRCEANVLYKNI
jgi:hypothetical protein